MTGLPVRHSVRLLPVQADWTYGHRAGRRVSSTVPTGIYDRRELERGCVSSRFVCLSAGLLEKLWANFHEFLGEVALAIGSSGTDVVVIWSGVNINLLICVCYRVCVVERKATACRKSQYKITAVADKPTRRATSQRTCCKQRGRSV